MNENLALRFFKEIDQPEVRCFYGFQVEDRQWSRVLIKPDRDGEHPLRDVQSLDRDVGPTHYSY